jgi:hypothetical protein
MYSSEWSYTNVLIRFSHNLTDVTSSTVLGYVSSYVRPVEMSHYHVEDFLNTQVCNHFRIIGQAHNFFPVFLWYHYLADHVPFILHSDIWWWPFSYQYLVFHEIENINILCLLHWKWQLFFCVLVKRSLLTYLIVYLRTGSSLIDLWPWTVSRLNFYSSSVFRQDLCPCLQNNETYRYRYVKVWWLTSPKKCVF